MLYFRYVINFQVHYEPVIMEQLLKVENLSVAFASGKKNLEVVSGLSFSLKRGEVLALVGESGCGKSASCLALTGLLPSPPASSNADRILFSVGKNIEDLNKISARKLRKIRGGKIAYIFQEPAASLNPVIRIGDQIAEVIALHRPEIKDYKAEIISLLSQVGIPSPETRINSYPHELSGGMQQRVMIAMALAGNPDLLIADEPTTALDVTVQAQILDLIDKIRKEREMAVILISHNLGVVSQLADRIIVMYAGIMVESGSAEDILKRAVHPYTKALISAVPELGRKCGRLNTIPGAVPSPGEFPAGCRFSNRCQSAIDGVCAYKRPEEKNISRTHSVSCHLFSESSGDVK